MNTIDIEKIIKENEELKQKNKELEEHLKKYTNNERHLKYYEANKQTIKEKAKSYMAKIKETNPEKLKEWRHNAYIKRKEKLNKMATDTNK
jgi:cell division septum initiation protein DivIVA